MRRVRVIPVLTLQNEKLVKTVKFKNPTYIGDPINAVKIFNDKEVDEIIILDISATVEKRPPNFERIEDIASEAFMPFGYGGGITTMEHIEKLFSLGIEKIILNSCIEHNEALIREAAVKYGSQSIVASIDVNKTLFGKYAIYTSSGKHKLKTDLISYVKKVQELGAGELFLNSIHLDGTYKGYDYDLISEVASSLDIPVVSCGGAQSINDFKKAIDAGASAVAAGSLFVYTGETKGILINYPTQKDLKENLFTKV